MNHLAFVIDLRFDDARDYLLAFWSVSYTHLLSSQYGEVGRDILLELSLKSGIDRQLLEDFYHWLKESNADRASTVIDLLKLYCCWLFERPVALKELLIYENTLEPVSYTHLVKAANDEERHPFHLLYMYNLHYQALHIYFLSSSVMSLDMIEVLFLHPIALLTNSLAPGFPQTR